METTAITAAMALLRLPQTAAGVYWQLIDKFGCAAAALQAPGAQLRSFLSEQALAQLRDYRRRGNDSALGRRLQQDLAIVEQLGVAIVDLHSSLYPGLLREIHRPPPLLYVKGDPACLSLPQIAVVGSRKPSPGGHHNAMRFSRALAEAGFAITSGMALGIDAAAHAGALAAAGKTLAVLGTGIDIVYPRRHTALAQSILDRGGALVSELPPATPACPSNFPQRNRLISGLSMGVLVVEAALKSGSLITARLGLQQNREVFAIPGSIHSPMSRGCHALIRDGATLVEAVEDMVEPLGGLLALQRQLATEAAQPEPRQIPAELQQNTEQLLAAMGYDPVSVDVLVERTGLCAGDINAGLISLELQGLISRTAWGYQRSP